MGGTCQSQTYDINRAREGRCMIIHFGEIRLIPGKDPRSNHLSSGDLRF